MEEILLKWIRASRNRQFNLIIAGRLSGIHGWKRMHVPIAFQVIGSTLILHFDGEERLVVADADGLAMQANETVEKPKWGGQKRSSRSGYPRG